MGKRHDRAHTVFFIMNNYKLDSALFAHIISHIILILQRKNVLLLANLRPVFILLFLYMPYDLNYFTK